MIRSVTDLIEVIHKDSANWEQGTKPWFRGESDDKDRTQRPRSGPLCPRIADYNTEQENHLLQSFRRQAGGLSDVPPRRYADMWLFLAQHYGIPTRLLDWTEGALLALYFAINRGSPNPRVYMLNPRKLNDLAGTRAPFPNYPLTWGEDNGSAQYIALAWQRRRLLPWQQKLVSDIGIDLEVPIAFPATYQDRRMIAQRSCFTIHGTLLGRLQDILTRKDVNLNDYLFEYRIDMDERNNILKGLSVLGVSAATIFPDLDNLASDLVSDLKIFNK